MSAEAAKGETTSSPLLIAQAFVRARKSATSLLGFPGTVPTDLVEAYACQEAAIPLWPDDVAGWKIGLVPSEFEARLGERRLAGPIFRHAVKYAATSAAPTPFAVFPGGFAAVEAEFVFELQEDAPKDKLSWTMDEAFRIPAKLRIGVELAGSPLATINALGPTVVISDFGNNAGLILGPPIEDWRDSDPSALVCSTVIDDVCVGRGNAALLPGGPVEALRWLLEHCARRARPLKTGQYVSSGAVTGVHDIVAGQIAVIDFGVHGAISCRAAASQDASPQQKS